MPLEQGKTARVEARISPEALDVVRRAAELKGCSLSDFLVDAARTAAYRVIEETQIIRLSIEDQHAFAESIFAPGAPNAALSRAAEVYRTKVKASE